MSTIDFIPDGEPLRKKFMDLCAEAEESILLCAPYVKQSVAHDIIASKNKQSHMELVTKTFLGVFHHNSSDLSAISSFINAGCNVYNCGGVHAKMYIFDENKCIITSANLTEGGLSRNFEAGVFTDDVAVVKSAIDYHRILSNDDNSTIVTSEIVADIESRLSRLPLFKEDYNSDYLFRTEAEAVRGELSGWERDVFVALDELPVREFDSEIVSEMAVKFQRKYPNNNNREAKIRQILQILRDQGLVQFVSPGNYSRLW